MKNTTKKILAGACLGLVGMGCLTGCAMSDEQKAALDLITEKSDKIVNLLEENMEYNNTQLSKSEAAEKIMIARNFWLSNKYQLNMQWEAKEFEGIYEKLNVVESGEDYILKNENNYLSARFSFLNGQRQDGVYTKKDFVNEIVYTYDEAEENFVQGEYKGTACLEQMWQIDFLHSVAFHYVVTPEMIHDIKRLEDGYELTIYDYTCGYENGLEKTIATRDKIVLILKNDKIVDASMESIYVSVKGFEYTEEDYKRGADTLFYNLMVYVGNAEDTITTATCKMKYNYENVDFTEVEQKFLQIEEEYLSV